MGLALAGGTGCAAVFPVSATVSAADPAAAELAIFRDERGWQLPATVKIDGERLMRLGRSSFARVYLRAGRHSLHAESPLKPGRPMMRDAHGNMVAMGPPPPPIAADCWISLHAGRSHAVLLTLPRTLLFLKPELRELPETDAEALAKRYWPVNDLADGPRLRPWVGDAARR